MGAGTHAHEAERRWAAAMHMRTRGRFTQAEGAHAQTGAAAPPGGGRARRRVRAGGGGGGGAPKGYGGPGWDLPARSAPSTAARRARSGSGGKVAERGQREQGGGPARLQGGPGLGPAGQCPPVPGCSRAAQPEGTFIEESALKRSRRNGTQL